MKSPTTEFNSCQTPAHRGPPRSHTRRGRRSLDQGPPHDPRDPLCWRVQICVRLVICVPPAIHTALKPRPPKIVLYAGILGLLQLVP